MAKYKIPSSIEPQYVCEKHAKQNNEFIVPTKKTTTTFLKKQKIDALLTIGKSHNLFLNMDNSTKFKKQEILDIIDEFYKKHCFEEIVNKKSKTANDTDLISIGKRMKEQLNQIPNTSAGLSGAPFLCLSQVGFVRNVGLQADRG